LWNREGLYSVVLLEGTSCPYSPLHLRASLVEMLGQDSAFFALPLLVCGRYHNLLPINGLTVLSLAPKLHVSVDMVLKEFFIFHLFRIFNQGGLTQSRASHKHGFDRIVETLPNSEADRELEIPVLNISGPQGLSAKRGHPRTAHS